MVFAVAEEQAGFNLAAFPGSAPSSQTHGRPRLLVVEDNPETRSLLRVLLREYTLDVAADPDEAWRFLSERDYDLVLMDINLGHGKLSGVDLLLRMRRVPRHEHIPVVAVTAYALPGDRQRFLRAGFTAYVSKPFLRESFLDTVRRCLNR